MKSFFNADVQITAPGREVLLLGWVSAIRKHANRLFLDIRDSSGKVQVVIDKDNEYYAIAANTPPESSVQITGVVQAASASHTDQMEVVAQTFCVINKATINLEPRPRSIPNLFDEDLTDYTLHNRHLFARSPQHMAIMRFRSKLMRILNEWFFSQGFHEVHTPLLTTVPLYDDRSVIGLEFGGAPTYLSQCAGFYLEAMAAGMERIYNIGPSFRGETSKSRRHLAEYWHVKAEMCWVTREDLLEFVEQTLYNVTRRCQTECVSELSDLQTEVPFYQHPFPRITYREAVRLLQSWQVECEFGTSLNPEAEDRLAQDFQSPFWVTSIPRKIEPFPYCIDPEDAECTMTADLILPNGYGELLGIAEKIHDPAELEIRMKEKGKFEDPRYDWVRQLREYGSVPHGGVGMGFERLIRWLLSLGHVREAIAFPRFLHRAVYP